MMVVIIAVMLAMVTGALDQGLGEDFRSGVVSDEQIWRRRARISVGGQEEKRGLGRDAVKVRRKKGAQLLSNPTGSHRKRGQQKNGAVTDPPVKGRDRRRHYVAPVALREVEGSSVLTPPIAWERVPSPQEAGKSS